MCWNKREGVSLPNISLHGKPRSLSFTQGKGHRAVCIVFFVSLEFLVVVIVFTAVPRVEDETCSQTHSVVWQVPQRVRA